MANVENNTNRIDTRKKFVFLVVEHGDPLGEMSFLNERYEDAMQRALNSAKRRNRGAQYGAPGVRSLVIYPRFPDTSLVWKLVNPNGENSGPSTASPCTWKEAAQ